MVGYFLICAFLAYGTTMADQSRVVNPGEVVKKIPTGDLEGTFERVALYPRAGQWSTAPVTRYGIFVRYPNAQATVIMCHGFMCDKNDAGALRRLFPKQLLNFLSFDFRGHGEATEGQHCTLGQDEVHDLLAAVEFVRSHPDTKDKPIIIFGFSMGAVIAIETYRKYPDICDALILDCPFDSSNNVIKRGLDHFKVSFLGYEMQVPGKTVLQRHAFHPYVQSLLKTILKAFAHMDTRNIPVHICPVNPARSAQSITVPTLFIHCKHDEKVHIDAVKSVFAGARGFKLLWLTNGRWHCDSFFYNPEKYHYMLKQFVRHVLSGTLNQKLSGTIIVDAPDGNDNAS